MILIIDNYDSFTYNLVQYFGELKQQVYVKRNDEITLGQIKNLSPEKIVISPGPGRPKNSGISCSVIKELGKNTPILGVCLGHQCIGEVFGAKLIKAKNLMHGKTSLIYHNGEYLFRKIKSPFIANRYHSLILDRKDFPKCLDIIAYTKENEIMGLRHKCYPIWGVQFHPESILTHDGIKILKNFLTLK